MLELHKLTDNVILLITSDRKESKRCKIRVNQVSKKCLEERAHLRGGTSSRGGEGGCRERYDSNGFCFALSLEIEMAKKGIFNDI